MRGAFSDPQGPRRYRLLPYVAPFAIIMSACTGTWDQATAPVVLGALALFLTLGVLPGRQRKLRTVDISCGAGHVRIRGARTRSQTIHAKQIVGASTARDGKNFVLTLAHDRRDEPMTLEVATEEEVEQIRHALGIGHGGYGQIPWRTTASDFNRVAVVARALAVAAGILAAVLDDTALQPLSGLLGLGAALGFLLGFVGLFSGPPNPSVMMTAGGLGLAAREGWFTIPYAAIHDVALVDKSLQFTVGHPPSVLTVMTRQPWNSTGLSHADAVALIQQIKAAAARARGYGRPKEDATGRVETLRRHGEAPRDWLVRLDMAGQSLGAAGGGYRGSSLEPDDLWKILEDPEADGELRAGAARVLRHVQGSDTKVRIDAAVAAVRDDATQRKLRIVIRDDIEDASGELAEIDNNERMKRYAMR